MCRVVSRGIRVFVIFDEFFRCSGVVVFWGQMAIVVWRLACRVFVCCGLYFIYNLGCRCSFFLSFVFIFLFVNLFPLLLCCFSFLCLFAFFFLSPLCSVRALAFVFCFAGFRCFGFEGIRWWVEGGGGGRIKDLTFHAPGHPLLRMVVLVFCWFW